MTIFLKLLVPEIYNSKYYIIFNKKKMYNKIKLRLANKTKQQNLKFQM